jgi:hypothetical protein
VNHSSYVDFTSNVSYDVNGSGFVTEVGDEVGSFRDNFAIRSLGTREHANSREHQQDFGHEGNGFWFQGSGISVTGNVAAGHTGNAFIVYSRSINHGKADQHMFSAANLSDQSIAGGQALIDTQHVPMPEFRDNVGYASSTGLVIRYHLRDAPHSRPSLFERSTFWNNGTGVNLPYSENLILRDLHVVRPFSLAEGTGIDANAVTRDITYENLTVTGYWRGIDTPRGGSAVIRGGHFNNLQNIVVRMATGLNRSVDVTGDIRFGTFPPAVLGREPQYQVVMRPQFEWDGLETTRAFLDSVVTLDYGPHEDARVFFHTQPADYVPFPGPISDIPTSYLGLTNEQLWTAFGVAVGGNLAPAGAVEVPGIYGLVAPGP